MSETSDRAMTIDPSIGEPVEEDVIQRIVSRAIDHRLPIDANGNDRPDPGCIICGKTACDDDCPMPDAIRLVQIWDDEASDCRNNPA